MKSHDLLLLFRLNQQIDYFFSVTTTLLLELVLDKEPELNA